MKVLMSNEWRPHPGQQTRFLSSPAFEALFGGAAGPGKTECLVMEALRQVHHPRYNAILFRRTFPRLDSADGMIARSQLWYPAYGGRFNTQKHFWTFPSGARIYFGAMELEQDRLTYQGSQFAFVGFDELTEFLEKQYMYMFTRCRVPVGSGLRAYVRAATNPGNLGHYWVKNRFVTTDIVNTVKYFARVNEQDSRVDKTHPDALSRAFYPALMSDNPSVDPEYRRRILMNPDPVEIARLLGGDWDAENTSGRVYPNWTYHNISERADYNPELPIIWGIDDGYAEGEGIGHANYHPRVILFGQVTPVGGVHVFAEYYATQELSETSLDAVLDESLYPYKRPEIAYVDSSAVELKARIWDRNIAATGATHDVGEGVKNLRRLICDGNEARLLHVHPRCVNLIREMPAYRIDERSSVVKTGEPRALKIDDHGPDALRYMTWHLRFG